MIVIGLVISTAIGAMVVSMLAPRPRTPSSAIFLICLSVGVGLALSSIVRLMGMALFNVTASRFIWLDLLLLIGLLVLSVVTSRSGPRAYLEDSRGPVFDSDYSGSTRQRFSMSTFIVVASLLVAVVCTITSFYFLAAARPHGNWDAWAMWNTKARFFYLGQANWKGALGREMGGVRPDYPLFLPLTVARLWAYAGKDTTLVPRIVAALFTALLFLLLLCGILRRRGIGNMALACLVLLGSSVLIDEASSQYADIVLSTFILAAIVLLTDAVDATEGVNRLFALTGVLAGCAAWTKNEGQFFVAALCIAAALVTWRRNDIRTAMKRLAVLLLGASPLLICTLGTKLIFSWRNDVFEEQTVGGAIRHLTNPGRYRALFDQFVELLPQCIAPTLLLLLAIYATIAFALARPRANIHPRAGVITATLTLLLLAAGYLLVYMVTPHDMEWHTRTSLSRLVLHLWPSVLLLLFCILPPMDNVARSTQWTK